VELTSCFHSLQLAPSLTRTPSLSTSTFLKHRSSFDAHVVDERLHPITSRWSFACVHMPRCNSRSSGTISCLAIHLRPQKSKRRSVYVLDKDWEVVMRGNRRPLCLPLDVYRGGHVLFPPGRGGSARPGLPVLVLSRALCHRHLGDSLRSLLTLFYRTEGNHIPHVRSHLLLEPIPLCANASIRASFALLVTHFVLWAHWLSRPDFRTTNVVYSGGLEPLPTKIEGDVVVRNVKGTAKAAECVLRRN
jgi:hypothetical protein